MESLDVLRAKARPEAEAELVERGFTRDGDDIWHGTLNAGEHGVLPARVQLPKAFPDILPEVFVPRSSLVHRVPHVEKSGKICLAPSTGVLLDTSNPRGIVAESLERAVKTLIDGLSGTNAIHFQEEFLAYWDADLADVVTSICDPWGVSRSVELVRLSRGPREKETMALVADNAMAAKSWASGVGWNVKQWGQAFFVRLTCAFTPPDFEVPLSTAQILDILRDSTSVETFQSLREWFKTVSLPATVVMSLPLEGEQGCALVGLRLEEAQGEAKQRAQRGFRSGHLPASLEMNFAQKRLVTRLHVDRLDAPFLLTRGGAPSELYSKTVAVIGCGAVGSHAAERMASLGIGRLRIVEPEVLRPENVHRHALGVRYIGLNKGLGMKKLLGEKLPHIQVNYREKDIETLLKTEADFVSGADLIFIAIGDETLELRLNDVLRGAGPRLHVWVEPLGVGGHVLLTNVTKELGCYRCLFGFDLTHGLFNQSAFTAPGQMFQKSFAGCAGTFTPFASVDADQAAVEAARLASRVLTGNVTENLLFSWRGDSTAFTRAGFHLSDRGRMFRDGERRRETRYGRRDCPSCAGKEDEVSAA